MLFPIVVLCLGYKHKENKSRNNWNSSWISTMAPGLTPTLPHVKKDKTRSPPAALHSPQRGPARFNKYIQRRNIETLQFQGRNPICMGKP